MRSRKSVASWHKRMEEIESISKGNDRRKARDKRDRIQHQIDVGLRNLDGTPKARLIKKNRHREAEGGAIDSGIQGSPVETNGNPCPAGSDQAGSGLRPLPDKGETIEGDFLPSEAKASGVSGLFLGDGQGIPTTEQYSSIQYIYNLQLNNILQSLCHKCHTTVRNYCASMRATRICPITIPT